MRACRLDQEVLYRYTPFRIDALLLGGCIALARRGPSPRSLMIVARVGFVVLSVALLSWLVSNPTARHDISGGYVYPVWRFTWGLSFIDAYAACILVMALEPGSIAFRLLNLSSLRWLGRISYGTYVFHDIFHLGFNRIVAHFTQYPKLPTAIFGLAFTLLAAWASFRYFETPFIRLKERWTIPSPDNETEIRNAAQEQATSNAIG
jgi:peptidoglycan/LPS O-acetylase OafA/YrhL